MEGGRKEAANKCSVTQREQKVKISVFKSDLGNLKWRSLLNLMSIAKTA